MMKLKFFKYCYILNILFFDNNLKSKILKIKKIRNLRDSEI